MTLRLEPLGDEDVDELIAERIPGELRERIARAAGGNPLFIEEMLAMAGEAEGEVVVPPTLQALLAARLDQLGAAERRVLERGAIEGEIFHRGAVQALTPNETSVTPRLAALVRKELIRPDRSQLAGDDGFRFRHLLIRDAAYNSLPKATRAELHERFATWLEQHGSELVELDEILGYHLERACNYRTELGMSRNEELAAAARRRLTAAGRRAHLRADYGAAASLLERAASLVSPAELDLALETDLVDALFWGGKGRAALERADFIARRASAAGDRLSELCGRIQAGIIRMSLEPEGAAERLAALVEQAQPVLAAAGHDLGLYTVYHGLAQVAFERAQTDAALEAYERAAAYGPAAGMSQEFLEWRAACCFYGTTPVSGVLAWLDEHQSRAGRRPLAPDVPGARAGDARALRRGATDARRGTSGAGRAWRGIRLAVTMGIESVDFELLAGEPAVAAEFGAAGCRLLEELGDKSFLSTAAANLARALFADDRFEEADIWAGRAAEIGASEDAVTQRLWRQVRAKVLARRGEHAEAERLVREAVAIGAGTDDLNGQGDAYADLAEVVLLAGKSDEAAAALELALARYERKGNLVSARRVRTLLAELGDAALR